MENLNGRYTAVKQKLFDARYGFLNENQREAVYTNEGPLLILAGAGSGKTTVLVNRVAFIIKYGNAYFGGAPDEPNLAELETLEAMLEHAGKLSAEELDGILEQFIFEPCPAYSILSITFTNKAANEMKTRLAGLLGGGAADIWAGTFHSVCVRILRRYIDRIGYERNFTIYDMDDVKRLITAVIKDFNISEESLSPRAVANAISRHKNGQNGGGIEYPEDISPGSDIKEREVHKIYEEYQKRLKQSNALDFDDIIALTVKLLQSDEEVREYYNGKFKYIHVDEYQDTNYAQYYLIRLLSGRHNNIMVVGDDDQSIYKFRGATIANILSFAKRFEDAKIIKLEQNYRSTKVILDAANGIIENNPGRLGKELWTMRDGGDKIIIKENNDQTDEANYIIEEINRLIDQEGKAHKDFAVLYRVNAQSANIETAFAKSIMPYRMLGGVRFYERKEIKDMLAYLCLINNSRDAVRLKRVINEPKRGIGDTTLAAVEQLALLEGKSMFEVISSAERYPTLSRSVNKLKGFADLINNLTGAVGQRSLPEVFEMVFEESGYRTMLEEAGQKGDRYDGRNRFGARETAERNEGKERLENVKELISQAITYEQEKAREGETAELTGFLEEVALISDIDKYDENADAVVLMTIHSAKGLEFPVVFLSGMEENVFPSMQSISDPEQLEEERRLAYVAVTRAKERLYLTYAKERLIYGRSGYNKISRFAEEVPGHTAEFFKVPESERRVRANMAGFGQKKHPPKVSPTSEFATAYTTASSKSDANRAELVAFKKGDMVEHANFGEGMITDAKSMGGDILYEVSFDSVGTKKIMGTYAKFKLKGE